VPGAPGSRLLLAITWAGWTRHKEIFVTPQFLYSVQSFFYLRIHAARERILGTLCPKQKLTHCNSYLMAPACQRSATLRLALAGGPLKPLLLEWGSQG